MFACESSPFLWAPSAQRQLICAANPWHGETWRTGILRFRVARSFGYGASAELVRGLLRRLDGVQIGGRLRIVSSLDAVLPVSTQGPTF